MMYKMAFRHKAILTVGNAVIVIVTVLDGTAGHPAEAGIV
jgi:hypothetical protein